MSEEAKSDLDVLFPGREVIVAGEAITVSPFKFGQLLKVAKFIAPIADAVRKANAVPSDGSPLSWALLLPHVIVDGGESVFGLLAFVTGKPRAWLDNLESDEGFLLAKTVFETNADFFRARIAPMLPTAPVEEATQAAGAVGAP